MQIARQAGFWIQDSPLESKATITSRSRQPDRFRRSKVRVVTWRIPQSYVRNFWRGGKVCACNGVIAAKLRLLVRTGVASPSERTASPKHKEQPAR